MLMHLKKLRDDLERQRGHRLLRLHIPGDETLSIAIAGKAVRPRDQRCFRADRVLFPRQR